MSNNSDDAVSQHKRMAMGEKIDGQSLKGVTKGSTSKSDSDSTGNDATSTSSKRPFGGGASRRGK